MRQAVADLAQDLETLMGDGAAVEIQSMGVETPGQAGLPREGGRIGDLLEGDTRATERRVGAPEALRPTEVGQA